MSEDAGPSSAEPTCARCARAPRDAEDLFAWVEIDGDEVCPGCLTLGDDERLRSERP